MDDCSVDIRRLAVAGRTPSGESYRGLPADAVVDLSRRYDLHGWQIEVQALAEGIVPQRYTRNISAFSIQDQSDLLASKVAVIGLGGLGGTVTEILARTGVGRLRLVDADRFDDSNFNRQLLSSMSLRGTPKAEAAVRRVAAVNPSVEVDPQPCRLDSGNAREIIADADVVVDCLDNLPSRFTLEAACRHCRRPLVSAAIAGQSGHVTTIMPEDRGLSQLFGPPEAERPPGAELRLGNLAATVTTLAALECAEVVKLVLRRPGILQNRLLVVDLTDYTFETVSLA